MALRIVQAHIHARARGVRNKTYPLRMVLDALSTYSLGYSLEETAARIKSKSGRAIGSRRSQVGSRSTKRS